MDNEFGVRINKYLAECGICSRRMADKLVETGKVSVNGKTAVAGDRVFYSDTIEVEGKRVIRNDNKVYLAFYKPVGIVCTEEKKEKNNIIDFIKYPIRVTYAGRLDKDSEGLMLLTNDGDMINALMRSRNNHEKEYIVIVNKPITKEFVHKLRNGVYLKELDVTTKPCQVRKIADKQFEIILTEGHNRQIRRMCETFGYKVVSLKRVRIANIKLGTLKKGQLRKLTLDEISMLTASVFPEQ